MKKTTDHLPSTAFHPPSTVCRLPSTVYLLLLTLFLFPSCFEPKKACLDIEAANFDASADKDCCCVYPKLKLLVTQNYNDTTFKTSEVYSNNLGQLFRIKSIVFYLSDFQLIQGGTTYAVSDTLSLRKFGANPGDTLTQIFTDDFLLIRRENISNEIGTFRQTGTFDSVKFRLGLPTDANLVVPGKAPAGHPLRPQGENLWQGRGAGYVFAQVIVNRDTLSATPPDTLSFTKADLPDYFITGGSLFHKTGYDFVFTLTTDFKYLFDGVDWTTGNKSDWKMKMRDNLPNVFLVSQ